MPDQTNTTPEHWRPVPGYETRYMVSDLGTVSCLPRRVHSFFTEPRVMRLQSDKDGYATISLFDGKKYKVCKVHRLVLSAFSNVPQPLQEANHKNGKKNDNRLENLEWCTRSENKIHSIRVLGRTSVRGEQHGRHKLTERQVIEIRAMWNREVRALPIARIFRISDSQVYSIVHFKKWAHVH